ncbi:MAG: vitamin K epoxide reductase family protein [Acidimicrobiales bacterium]
MSPAPGPVARWVPVLTLQLSLAGLGVSGYLTFTHFAGTRFLACSATGLVECGVVTTSPQSYVLDIPVAVLGLVGFVALVVLMTPAAWRSARSWVHWTRLALVTVSMAMVLWLVAAELLIIGHICVWCTAVHVITFALFAIVMAFRPRPRPAAAPDAPTR